jgi:hypothetical protein
MTDFRTSHHIDTSVSPQAIERAKQAFVKTCVQCGFPLEHGQYVFQGGWRHKPQCRAWKQCEARLGHRYDKYLNLVSCTRDDCPNVLNYSHQNLQKAST